MYRMILFELKKKKRKHLLRHNSYYHKIDTQVYNFLCQKKIIINFKSHATSTTCHSSKPASWKSGEISMQKQEDSLLKRERPHIQYLFHLQPMTPNPFQQVTKTGNQGIIFHPCDVHFPMSQFHSLSPHLLHQHPLGL